MPSPIIDPTLRGATTQDLILIAIVDRLRGKIADYNDQNCWESDDPVPDSHDGGDEFCTVCFGDGSFPNEFFAGGGDATLTEMGSIIIAPSVLFRGDRPRRRRRRLVGNSADTKAKSLLNRKRQILTALFADHWDLADGAKPLLRDMPSPVRCTAPGEIMVGQAKYSQMRLTIETTFDWDLSNA